MTKCIDCINPNFSPYTLRSCQRNYSHDQISNYKDNKLMLKPLLAQNFMEKFTMLQLAPTNTLKAIAKLTG